MSKQTELAQVADTITVDSGNVGIGTSSPTQKLEISDALDATIRLTSTDNKAVFTPNVDTYGTIEFYSNDASAGGAGIKSAIRSYVANTAGGQSALAFSTSSNSLNDVEAMRIDSSGRVGIGTSSPVSDLHIENAMSAGLRLIGSTTGANTIYLGDTASGSAGYIQYSNNADYMRFASNGSERMRLDSSGNLLVGKTSADNSAGATIKSDGEGYFVKSNGSPLSVNRLSSDGAIQYFFKDTSLVGSVGTAFSGSSLYIDGASNRTGVYFATAYWGPRQNGANIDNQVDLGAFNLRFDDIYATNGTIQTSDRNEKQDIAELSDAEQRVAVAAKGLMRKFRWRDAVEAKGDEARTHFGIIAQDLQAAFAAEGLDAGDYAMFISSTWWEHDVEVPAVEAVAEVLDEEGNVVTEAVEAKDAYTRTDTYDTQEEAPEGATERTRLGVRYSELLAFIIGAL